MYSLTQTNLQGLLGAKRQEEAPEDLKRALGRSDASCATSGVMKHLLMQFRMSSEWLTFSTSLKSVYTDTALFYTATVKTQSDPVLLVQDAGLYIKSRLNPSQWIHPLRGPWGLSPIVMDHGLV